MNMNEPSQNKVEKPSAEHLVGDWIPGPFHAKVKKPETTRPAVRHLHHATAT